MCGILGKISLNENLTINKSYFLKSLSLLNHRGPDDEGYFINSNIAFGHKRLSIIDLSKGGVQPMFSSDKSSVICYNGEIYNYKELKNSLKQKGYKFNNKTDTEVLLNGLIHEGPEFIEKCNGMFAFAFHNKRKKISYIFRDRIGIKPLFYSINNKEVIFSSNVNSLISLDKINKKLDKESVSSYFSFRQPIQNKTFFKNIFSLEPGHYIEIKKNKVNIKKYWDFNDFFLESFEDKGEKFYKDRLYDLVKSSVKYRLISDVKIASLLSGGLDSTIIASILNEEIGKNFLAYSIGYSYKDYNEFKYSKIAAKGLNMKHIILSTDAEKYFEDMEKLIKLRGQPLTIPNEISQYQLCRLIKKKATVVLSGSGADELFCGYGRIFSSTDDFKKIKNKQIFKNLNQEKKFFINVENRYGRKNFSNYLEHFLKLYNYTDDKIKQKILHSDFNHKKINQNIRSYFKKIFDNVETKNYLIKMQYFFQKYHLKGILEREDIASMASSIELRVPFLDHRIIEFAATIPSKYKIKLLKEKITLTSNLSSEVNDIPKYILRKSFEKNIPKSILQRKKVGFPVPLHFWMSNKKIKEKVYDTLLSNNSLNRGIFNMKYIKGLLNDRDLYKFDGSAKIYQGSKAHKIWMCYNLETFFSSIE